MVRIRGLTGELHTVPEKWATLLAENLRNFTGEGQESARSAADKIESRLVGVDGEPIEFDGEEILEVTQALEGMIGWNTPDAHALFWSLSGLPSYRPND